MDLLNLELFCILFASQIIQCTIVQLQFGSLITYLNYRLNKYKSLRLLNNNLQLVPLIIQFPR